MENKNVVRLAVLVAALGYFVDIYDLLLFSIVRVVSLREIGVPEDQLLSSGVLLINTQMAGLLLGGILWGILGDKKGRLSVLFGSIFLYSTANILNSLVHSVELYAVFRFLAGVGLAGELGAGVTLVCELMPKHTRGYGTMIVASIGILGAVLAALIGDHYNWRTAYQIGGGMGFALLAMRAGLGESSMYREMKGKAVSTGNFFALFSRRAYVRRYLSIIIIGIPIWFMIGVLVTFSPEFGKAFGMAALPTAGKGVMYCYLGSAAGDFISGWISQILRSRKQVLLGFIVLLGFSMALYFFVAGKSLFVYYGMCAFMGFAAGYWAIFVTVAAEQFGTNLRATATTTVPNFVRGSVIPLTILFQFLRVRTSILEGAAIVGSITIIAALLALKGLPETFGKDLEYTEAC